MSGQVRYSLPKKNPYILDLLKEYGPFKLWGEEIKSF
jgi:hypothetical protein